MRVLGIDVGGTFIDFVLSDEDVNAVHVLKRSRGKDAADGIVVGVREICEAAGIAPHELDLVIHGTTVGTNAILQYKGAKTGMVTTEGFRDVLHIGRHQRPQNYSIQQDIPWQVRPLVQRRYRISVKERVIPPDGEVLIPLDRDEVHRAADQLSRDGVEAVAVCFLFAYLNPRHELEAAEIVREAMPDAFVCTSSEVVPQFREFERFTTTAINAFIGPQVSQYMRRLQNELREIGVGADLQIMQSNGGTTSAATAQRRPVTLLLSGPVGGVIGGIWAAQGATQQGNGRGIRTSTDATDGTSAESHVTLDVGGTSADIGIILGEGLVEARSRDTWIAGYPVNVPMVDITSIGAGGGSVAYLDEAGALHVGPRSAGALPGPACYGRGGVEPTLTDANVLLGRLPRPLAGDLETDRSLARKAMERIAAPLSRSTTEAAAAVVRIVNEAMAGAIRTATIERGLDPRNFRLVAFGGAGPLQAAELARILGISEVLVPPRPGVTSAAGLLTSDLRHDIASSYLKRLRDVDPAELERRCRDLDGILRTELSNGEPDSVRVEWGADLRYRGQSYELKVPLTGDPERGIVSTATLDSMRQAFHLRHRSEFGHHFPDHEVELVTLRFVGSRALPDLPQPSVRGTTLSRACSGKTKVVFAHDSGAREVSTPVYDRELLPVDETLKGPAIIEQRDATTLIPPARVFRRDQLDNVIITDGHEG